MFVLSLVGYGDFDGVSKIVTNPAELYSMTPNEGGMNGGTEISLTGTKYFVFFKCKLTRFATFLIKLVFDSLQHS